ncbi:hypothetical protein SAMD00023353_2000150 [Rosellinia necatrix]|uniref:Uncharacterized protein n=1 Tax=Rosellinia necatrix TaxID=77044 RepID=A0A1S8A7Z6_ROSNE|nr:hypothetical protein SAMD00023353_2000150 [Rosellinia necatrix]
MFGTRNQILISIKTYRLVPCGAVIGARVRVGAGPSVQVILVSCKRIDLVSSVGVHPK